MGWGCRALRRSTRALEKALEWQLRDVQHEVAVVRQRARDEAAREKDATLNEVWAVMEDELQQPLENKIVRSGLWKSSLQQRREYAENRLGRLKGEPQRLMNSMRRLPTWSKKAPAVSKITTKKRWVSLPNTKGVSKSRRVGLNWNGGIEPAGDLKQCSEMLWRPQEEGHHEEDLWGEDGNT